MSFIDAHTHKKKSPYKSLVSLCLTDDLGSLPDYFTIGIHPWNIDRVDCFEKIIQYALDKRCYAIGETGIDRSQDYLETLEKQRLLIEKHIQLSIEIGKPLVLHCVRGFSDILEYLNKYQFTLPILFHDFNGNQKTLEQLSRFNCYFSYGDKLYKKDSKGFKVLCLIPAEKLLLETDDSERGIEEVYQRAASLLRTTPLLLKKQIETNFENYISRKALDK